MLLLIHLDLAARPQHSKPSLRLHKATKATMAPAMLGGLLAQLQIS